MPDPRVKFGKPPLTFAAQVDLLIKRGLAIEDRQAAENFLRHINYYRFSAYFLPFQYRADIFNAGTTFDQIKSLYLFDRKLRNLLDEALEPIEIALRTTMAYRLAHTYGSFAHVDPKNFYIGFDHPKWHAELLEHTTRSKEVFVRHFQEKYLEYPELPIWTAVEIMSFGALSKMYTGLKNQDKRAIADPYKVDPKTFVSWFHSLVYIRNICAHHSRLWNRELSIAPRLPPLEMSWDSLSTPDQKRTGIVLLLLKAMIDRTPFLHFDSAGWRKRVVELIEGKAPAPNIHVGMGLPKDWVSHPVWAVKV